MITKVPLNLVRPSNTSGNVVAQGQSLAVVPTPNSAGEPLGVMDNTTGVLTLNLPGIGKFSIGGFTTRFDVGVGERGTQGIPGTPGTDGVLGAEGLQGPRGCRGPAGPQGKPGPRGPRGVEGPMGPTGATGAQGIRGLDGRVQIYIQSEDPGPVGAGAIWIVP